MVHDVPDGQDYYKLVWNKINNHVPRIINYYKLWKLKDDFNHYEIYQVYKYFQV